MGALVRIAAGAAAAAVAHEILKRVEKKVKR